MDYEKKYKKLKADIEKAYLFAQTDSTKAVLEHIFPELAESEDEKIRKEIVEVFKSLGEGKLPVDINYADIFTWLEKQGEQRVSVVDFKAKDWYVSKVDGKIYNAKFMEKTPNNQARRLEIEKAAMSATGIIEREEWFIKGAEWADENPFCVQIEKQGEKLQYWKPSEEQLEALDYAYNSCPDTEIGNRYEGVLETLIDDLYKLLKKQGEQKPQRIISAEAKEAMYDKPTWSEEDEETLGWLCTFLKEYGNPFYDGNEENVIDWLKQLKDRMKGE